MFLLLLGFISILTVKYEFTNEKTNINIEEIADQLKEALNDKDLFKKDKSE